MLAEKPQGGPKDDRAHLRSRTIARVAADAYADSAELGMGIGERGFGIRIRGSGIGSYGFSTFTM